MRSMPDIRVILMGCVVFIIFLFCAIVCLRWPDRVQKFALKYYERHTTAALFNPWLGLMKTPSYISWLRVIGIMALVGSAVLLYGLILAISKDFCC